MWSNSRSRPGFGFSSLRFQAETANQDNWSDHRKQKNKKKNPAQQRKLSVAGANYKCHWLFVIHKISIRRIIEGCYIVGAWKRWLKIDLNIKQSLDKGRDGEIVTGEIIWELERMFGRLTTELTLKMKF